MAFNQPPAKRRLELSLKVTVILLCSLILVYGGLRLVDFLYDIVALVGGTLMVTYLLLGPVNTVESAILVLFRLLPKGVSRLNPRMLSVFVVYLGFLMLVILSVIRFLPLMSVQIKGFAQDLPVYVSQLEERISLLTENPSARLFLNRLEPGQGQLLQREPASLNNAVLPGAFAPSPKGALGQLLSWIQRYSSGALTNLLDLATNTLARIIYLLTSLVVLFYLLLDGEKLREGMVHLLPASAQTTASHFLESTHDILYTFIKGQVILGFLAGFFMFAVYSLFGVKYAGFLGAFFGFASVLPVVGPWIGLIPGALVVIFSPTPFDLTAILMLTGGFYILKEYWLIPKIVGTTLEIHPVVVILAFLACNKLAGVSGVLMAFPVASLISVAFQYFQGTESSPTQGPNLSD